ncbi:NAD(P)H-hydrate dehydratase [Varunaivibrio sulfuroxidans]|uniref:Bifunctional NAD(P)H-hydrate repair enzyme n=1 Tax=Varunaivibrio sulfuroxidans TaxID=1773489 RepID=A0A4R3JFQ4_9PROT|nr:NAD(P)H-hydrate dehydratase [Varunaivibrio sulfuroxidans]TCS64113.1 NAD(P)H-hydrate epimerase [Varunaivibrio sulfuroxidans]WES31439.1 NAD(P)H-hydrate dehydratase [Varunaivibrio sulfuroxidans]
MAWRQTENLEDITSGFGREELLTVAEMAMADRLTIAGDVAGRDLMAAAGRTVADEILKKWSRRSVVVLCGPGNNGGDGFVVARALAEAGWPVRVASLANPDALSGDAAHHFHEWRGETAALSPDSLDFGDAPVLVVDALFGAGLDRPLAGVACAVIEAIGARGLDCVAVDMPSGVHGDSGEILGAAARAVLTVTFFRGKPGHYLFPGRALRGELCVRDIGIADAALGEIRPMTTLNTPDTWLSSFPIPALDGHKYLRGHGVIAGGAEMTGAARLAARAARRAGAGLVTIAAPPAALGVYAAGDPGNIVIPVDGVAAFEKAMTDRRVGAVLVGPGAGREGDAAERTRALTRAALATAKPVVLDADALTVHAESPGDLFPTFDGPVVLTPHAGEFARLFADLEDVSKLTRARAAARRSGAVVVLKGADTVIAAPDGRAAINANAPPTLATAGSGDVLAGVLIGLLAQGMPPYAAARAAVWLHGRAAQHGGWGLIAEDIGDLLPQALADVDALMNTRFREGRQ